MYNKKIKQIICIKCGGKSINVLVEGKMFFRQMLYFCLTKYGSMS